MEIFGRDCGCDQRKAWIEERTQKMPALLRPDMKSLVWLAIGAFLVPLVMQKIR